MSAFPEADTPGIVDVARAMAEPSIIDQAHIIAEDACGLYKVTHGSISSHLKTLGSEPRFDDAFLAGVRAFEALGGVTTGHDRLSALSVDEIMQIFVDVAAYSEGAVSVLDFLESLERERAQMELETPYTVEAVGVLARVEIRDTSETLRNVSTYGAACIRSIQMDVEAGLRIQAEIDNL